MSTDLPFHPLTGLQALGVRRNGDPIWPVLGAADDEEGDSEQEETSEDETEESKDGEDESDDKPLGPAGEKALQAEKDKRKTAAAQARTEKARADAAEAELAKLRRAAERAKPKADDKTDAPDAEEIRREAEQAATAKANDRIIRAEIRAAAAGKLTDPKDALNFLDLTKFEVDADGNIDADEIADAIDDLLKNKPYLAVAQGDGKRFKGSGDGGAKPNKPTRPKSLTEAVTKALSPS